MELILICINFPSCYGSYKLKEDKAIILEKKKACRFIPEILLFVGFSRMNQHAFFFSKISALSSLIYHDILVMELIQFM